MDLGLRDKVALIAGGSRGIGAAAARALAKEGVKVVIAARDREGLLAITEELETCSVEVLGVQADFTQPDAGDKAVKATLDRFGRLDIVVASVGAAQGGLFWEIGDDVWEAAFALKFMGTVRLLRAAAPVMKAQGSGAMVVVVGNNGRQPQARLMPGSSVNAALLAVVKGLADELAGDGVRVNAINPGPTRTDRWTTLMRNLSLRSNRSEADEEAQQLAMIPMGRINEADEMGKMIAVMSSDIAPTMTGVSVTADGGATKALA
jgi:NAD(P)-dependent dehydrogenase (short-subunit alcohol dehydrogenase family)